MNDPVADGAPGLPDTDTLAAMADALPWPLLLLRDDASLLHANRAARRMLERGEPLRSGPGGAVGAAAPGQRETFAAALGAAIAGTRPLLLGPGGAIALAPLDGAGPTRAPVLVALSAAPREGEAGGFARAHGLSRAESRVLARLTLGDRPDEAAQVLGVTAATVRSQLVAIRRKTGHASAAALVAAASAADSCWPPGAGHD